MIEKAFKKFLEGHRNLEFMKVVFDYEDSNYLYYKGYAWNNTVGHHDYYNEWLIKQDKKHENLIYVQEWEAVKLW